MKLYSTSLLRFVLALALLAAVSPPLPASAGPDLCIGDDSTGDSDGDGFCDDVDACSGSDASGNSDGDAFCNDTDTCPGFDDSADADLDTVADGCDICPGFDDRVDTDLDTVPNGCDACTGNDASGDSDGDDVCNNLDACVGDDSTGDSDSDDVCDDIDLCTGNDASGNSDADSVCNDTDACAGFDDSADADLDQQPDGCDLCQNLAGARSISVKPALRFTKVNTDLTASNDGMKFSGEFVSGTAFSLLNPVADGIEIDIRELGSITPLVRVSIPGGAGWTAKGTTKFQFKDPTGANGGIRKVSIQDRNRTATNQIKFKVQGAKTTYPYIHVDVPLTATVSVGTTVDQCGEARFAVSACSANGAGSTISCTID